MGKETLEVEGVSAKHHDKLSDGTIIGDIFAPLPIDEHMNITHG